MISAEDREMLQFAVFIFSIQSWSHLCHTVKYLEPGQSNALNHFRDPLQMAPCTDNLVGCPLKPTFLSSDRRPTKCKSLQRAKMGKKHHDELHAVRDRFDDGRTLYVLCSEYSSSRGIPSSLILCALSIESLSGVRSTRASALNPRSS